MKTIPISKSPHLQPPTPHPPLPLVSGGRERINQAAVYLQRCVGGLIKAESGGGQRRPLFTNNAISTARLSERGVTKDCWRGIVFNLDDVSRLSER